MITAGYPRLYMIAAARMAYDGEVDECDCNCETVYFSRGVKASYKKDDKDRMHLPEHTKKGAALSGFG